MRAIVQDTYGSAGVLRLEEVEPPAIGDDEVLVRVHAAGVDPGVWHLMAGLPLMIRVMGFGLRAPKARVPGMDLAGCVEAVGKKVTELRPGEEVYGVGQGSFAELARAEPKHLAPKPANLTFEEAAAVPTSALTALQGLRDVGGVQAGQKVLVIGASGGVGSFGVQLAKAFGAEVTGVCSTPKLDTVRALGAAHVIDYTHEDFTRGDARYDVVLDTAGHRSLRSLRRALTPRGTLVIVGGEGGGRWMGGTDRQLRAMMWSPFLRQKLRSFIAVTRAADLEFLKERIEAGQVTPLVDRTLPLSAAADAIRSLAEGHARGKTVLRVVGDGDAETS